MKDSKTHRTPEIGSSMRRLRAALLPVTTSTTAEEIAFHLAELKPELRQLLNLLDQIEKYPPITPAAMNAVLYFVDVHWPYHFNELRKLMKMRAIVRYAESDEASPVQRGRRRLG